MSTTAEDTYDPSMKTPAFKFDGRDKNWRMFKTKFLSVANKRGWMPVLTQDPGDVEDESMRTSTEAAVIAKLKKNNEAMMYLVMSVECKKAFMYLENTQNVYIAWNRLMQRYERNEDEDLVLLLAEFSACKPKNAKEDPELYFIELEYLNRRIVSAGGNEKETRR